VQSKSITQQGYSMKLIALARSKAAEGRSALFKRFIASFTPPVRVIDLGGTVAMWERWGLSANDDLQIDLANNFSMDVNYRDALPRSRTISKLTIDVSELTEADYARYDVIFSNSMLEHLASFEQQKLIAQKIVQSRSSYFIQVPNRNSLIDPHFAHPIAPFFAAWPRSLQVAALQLSGLNGGKRARSPAQAEDRLRYYHPLSVSEMRSMFGDAKILIERSFGIPMSIVALRRSQ
jgi:hypothetical protein